MSGSENDNLEMQEEMEGLRQELQAPQQSGYTGYKQLSRSHIPATDACSSTQDLLYTSLEKENGIEQEKVQLQDGTNQIPLLMEENKREDKQYDTLDRILKNAASQRRSRKVQMAISLAQIRLHEVKKIEARIKANVVNANIVKPTFSSSQISHPLNFIENLTTYLEKINSKDHTVDDILDCLEGEAKSWAEVFKSRWADKDDFIKDFFQQYWGRAEQSLLKKEIYSGRWNKQKETMSQHFINLISQAKWLPNKIPDDELVFEIMQHFPKHVQSGWCNSAKSSMIEATEFLRKNDEIEMLERRKNAGRNQVTGSKFAFVKHRAYKNNIKTHLDNFEKSRMWKQRQNELMRNQARAVPKNHLLSESLQLHVSAGSVHSNESKDEETKEEMIKNEEIEEGKTFPFEFQESNTRKSENIKDVEVLEQEHQSFL